MSRRLRISAGRFRRYVIRAQPRLPAAFIRAGLNVAVVVEEWPRPDDYDRVDDRNSLLFGVFRGGPEVRQGVIAVFRRPHLRYCRSKRRLKEEVRRTLLHEFGHLFGLDEAAVAHL